MKGDGEDSEGVEEKVLPRLVSAKIGLQGDREARMRVVDRHTGRQQY